MDGFCRVIRIKSPLNLSPKIRRICIPSSRYIQYPQYMNDRYTTPDLGKDGFNCPYCNAFAHQAWWSPYVVSNDLLRQYHEEGGWPPFDPDGQMCIMSGPGNSPSVSLGIENMFISSCIRCKKTAIWFCNKMVYPISNSIPMPNDDLPDHIKKHYNEARDIFNLSIRGAMALLRLGLQELCIKLDGSGKSIDDDIKMFVREKNLPVQIQKSLDVIRVTGNHAVHPGEINFEANKENAQTLFELINVIVDVMITQPKKIDKIYNDLPERDRKNIAKRDGGVEQQ